MMYFVKISCFNVKLTIRVLFENMILIYLYPHGVTSLSFHMGLLIATYFIKSPQMYST